MHQLGGTVWKELRRCYHCGKKTVSLLTNMRQQVLLNPLLCVVEGILSVAQMVKEIQQNLKQKFPTLFR